MLDPRTQRFVLGKLSAAIEDMLYALSPRESIYRAYRDNLQWLEDLDDLPGDLQCALRDLHGTDYRCKPANRVAETGQRLSQLPDDAVAELIHRFSQITVKLHSEPWRDT